MSDTGDTLYVGPVWIGPEPDPINSGFDFGWSSTTPTAFTNPAEVERMIRADMLNDLFNKQSEIKSEHESSSAKLDEAIKDQLSSIKLFSEKNSGNTSEKLKIQSESIKNLILQNTLAFNYQSAVAGSYYGKDTTSSTFYTPTWRVGALSYYMEKWLISYEAALQATLLNEKITTLNDELAKVDKERSQVALELEATQREQQRIARQAMYKAPGTLALPANVTAITVEAHGLVLAGERLASLSQAISNGVAALTRAAAAGPGAYVAAVASLFLYSSPTADPSQDRTPDSVRYGFGTNADKLGLSSDADLQAIASNRGTVEMPVRLINKVRGDQSVISAVSTDGVRVPKSVPVWTAVINSATNLYEVVIPNAIPGLAPITLTWTPVDVPGSINPSSTTPATSQDIPVYIGTTLQPVVVDVKPYPGELPNINDFIIWFPSDSGINPTYVMFNSPYEGATTKGEHSGRMYDPESAGGATQNLDWTKTSINQDGIDLVKLHTGRFEQSDGNDIMIGRLERILSGEISMTDVDKRFYTHEIRELERYRSLGVADGVEGNVWNNAHTATLEDFKLKGSVELFYTPEAIAAEKKQVYGG